MGSKHNHLLFHTEVRLLSCEKILHSLFKLHSEFRVLLLDKADFLEQLCNVKFLATLAYLENIFEKLNFKYIIRRKKFKHPGNTR